MNIFESYTILALDRNNKPIGIHEHSRGGKSQTICDARLIFKFLIEIGASYFIGCHNHPSGNLTPSEMDFKIHKHLTHLGEMLNIICHDNVIITNDGFVSLHEYSIQK